MLSATGVSGLQPVPRLFCPEPQATTAPRPNHGLLGRTDCGRAACSSALLPDHRTTLTRASEGPLQNPYRECSASRGVAESPLTRRKGRTANLPEAKKKHPNLVRSATAPQLMDNQPALLTPNGRLRNRCRRSAHVSRSLCSC